MRKSILPTHHEYKRYSEAFKQSIISEYQDSGCSMYYLKVKYGIRSNSTVSLWVKNSLGHRKEFYLSARKNPVIMSEEKSDDSLEVKNLKRRIKELERELEDAKLLSEAYSMMIKKAEEELKISIRKKHNTK